MIEPAYLAFVNGVSEEIIHQEVGQLRVLVEGGLDIAQEYRPGEKFPFASLTGKYVTALRHPD